MKQFGKFMPQFFGTTGNKIQIENLIYPADPATVSIMDLKIGTSTVTQNCLEADDEKLARRLEKDKISTSQELGFKFTGYEIRDPETN